LFFELSLLVVFVFFAGLILSRFNIPLVAAYIIAGIVSQVVLKNIFFKQIDFDFSRVADIGVILLMFTIGIEFPLNKIFKFKSRVFILASIQVTITTLILTTLFIIFRYTPSVALVIGMLFSFSSTVIVAKYLSEKGLIHEDEGELSMAILIIQDLIVIPGSIILPLFLQANTEGAVFVINIFFILLKSSLIFLSVFLFVSKIMPFFLDKLKKTFRSDLLLLLVISLSLFMSSLSAKLGFPLSVGAFLAGITVSMTTERFAIFSEIRPIRDVFSIVFFVFLGFSIDITYVVRDLPKILLVTIFVIFIKIAVTYLTSVKSFIHPKNAFKIAINLSQISEFAFILSSIYFKSGLLQASEYKMIVAVTLLTIIISPFLVKEESRILKKYKNFFAIKENRAYVFAENLLLQNHVVLCGFGRIGQRVIKNLLVHGIPFVIIDDNRKEVEALQGKGLNAVYGDATEIEILNFANVKTARTVVVAVPDRFSQEAIISHALRLNPQIIVYGRAHENTDKKYLYAIGARYVLYPEFEGAMALSKRILKLYKVDDEEISLILKRNFEDEKII
jgi:monovalent cation:H+ antiporter-2, CPA2 family